MSEQKRRPPRRKGKGNTGITATHITVYTMNGEPLPDEVKAEVETFLAGIVKRHSSRLMVNLVTV